MSWVTGGGYADGSYNLGTPSGGGTFINHYPVGGPVPGAEGYGSVPGRSTEQVSTASWSDVLKGLALAGGQLVLQKTLGDPSSPSQAPATPNNKGQAGAGVEPIPGDLRQLPDAQTTTPAGRDAAISNIAKIGLVAAGLAAVVLIPMMTKGS